MNLQDKINLFNKNLFFKEFVYSENNFFEDGERGLSKEAADCLVCLDEIVFIFQIKEKMKEEGTQSQDETWLKNRIHEGKTQIKDSLRYLKSGDLKLCNTRGDSFNLSIKSNEKCQKIILYSSKNGIEIKCQKNKFYKSSEVGIIHVLSAEDWASIALLLVTISEVDEYLNFRKSVCLNYPSEINNTEEIDLLGQFVSGRHQETPSSEFRHYHRTMLGNFEKWDISGLLRTFKEKLTHSTGNDGNDYYFILKELSKLKRYELIAFKSRLNFAIQSSKLSLSREYRMQSQHTGCGFIIVAISQKDSGKEHFLLQAYTELHKYDLRSKKCIGLIVFAEKSRLINFEWCFMNFPWRNDKAFDKQLKTFPLRSVSQVIIPRFEFAETYT